MSEQIDPNDYVITRKRKKYRFAKFYNAVNCFEFDEWTPHSIDVIEVGAGTALFLVELASRHPDLTYLAVDVKADRLQKGAYEALSRGLGNISFVRARADQIDQLVKKGSVREVWLTFSDPFPKKRSAGRRLTHPIFLKKYKRILANGGHLKIKHDNGIFFSWSLEQLVHNGWHIEELAFDLHAAEGNQDAKVLTSYEERWLSEGLRTQYVSATIPDVRTE